MDRRRCQGKIMFGRQGRIRKLWEALTKLGIWSAWAISEGAGGMDFGGKRKKEQPAVKGLERRRLCCWKR